MSEERGTGGYQEFRGSGPGTTPGGDPTTLDRRLGTAGPRASDQPSAAELAQRAAVVEPGSHADESRPAVDDKSLHELLPELADDELGRLTVLEAGTALEQGGTYLDLNDLARGPFKAIGGQAAGPGNRYVAKRDTDYELWNRLAGQHREPDVERPATPG